MGVNYRQSPEFARAVHLGRIGDRGFPNIVKDSWEYAAASRMRARAKRDSAPFEFGSIAECACYLVLLAPKNCPVLGFPLKYLSYKQSEKGRLHSPESASVDKIRPGLGYAKGNIRIISHLANSMKRDASPEQLRAFAEWVIRGG